jgi:hypothetical protein
MLRLAVNIRHGYAISSQKRGPSRLAWKSIPVTESNLSAYMRSSDLVHRLDEIAHDARLPIQSDQSVAFPGVENATLFGLPDIATLDQLLEENQEAVVRMSQYSFTDQHILRGHSILYLFDVLGAQLGEDGVNLICLGDFSA